MGSYCCATFLLLAGLATGITLYCVDKVSLVAMLVIIGIGYCLYSCLFCPFASMYFGDYLDNLSDEE